MITKNCGTYNTYYGQKYSKGLWEHRPLSYGVLHVCRASFVKFQPQKYSLYKYSAYTQAIEECEVALVSDMVFTSISSSSLNLI